jgi:hypothetical protein
VETAARQAETLILRDQPLTGTLLAAHLSPPVPAGSPAPKNG